MMKNLSLRRKFHYWDALYPLRISINEQSYLLERNHALEITPTSDQDIIKIEGGWPWISSEVRVDKLEAGNSFRLEARMPNAVTYCFLIVSLLSLSILLFMDSSKAYFIATSILVFTSFAQLILFWLWRNKYYVIRKLD